MLPKDQQWTTPLSISWPPPWLEQNSTALSIMTNFLVHIWNLCITFPDHNIAFHANNVKSCFRQLKHHPNDVGAFAFLINTILILQQDFSFGTAFSSTNCEPIQFIAEELVPALCNDYTLQEKHMITNPVDINIDCISTTISVIVDQISHFPNLLNPLPHFLALAQDIPQLQQSRCFHLNSEIFSCGLNDCCWWIFPIWMNKVCKDLPFSKGNIFAFSCNTYITDPCMEFAPISAQ